MPSHEAQLSFPHKHNVLPHEAQTVVCFLQKREAQMCFRSFFLVFDFFFYMVFLVPSFFSVSAFECFSVSIFLSVSSFYGLHFCFWFLFFFFWFPHEAQLCFRSSSTCVLTRETHTPRNHKLVYLEARVSTSLKHMLLLVGSTQLPQNKVQRNLST